MSMSEISPEVPKNELTPQQAADVIQYYNDGENAQSRQKGWKDKVPLGQSAIHTTRERESLLPTGTPILTNDEMGRGLDHLTSEPPQSTRPKATDEMLDTIVDRQNVSYDDARRILRSRGFDVDS